MEHCDTAYARIARPAAKVYAFLAEPENLSLWSFGTWSTEIDAGGLVRGTAIGDGSQTYVRIRAHPRQLLIDYLIGARPDDLCPRVFARIAEGTAIGGGEGECALLMTALRTEAMDDERWEALKAAHAFEVRLIKSALETGYDHRNPA